MRGAERADQVWVRDGIGGKPRYARQAERSQEGVECGLGEIEGSVLPIMAVAHVSCVRLGRVEHQQGA